MLLKKLFEKKVKKETYLIIGLGNPGREYKQNRHNIGFLAIDRLSKVWDIPLGHLRNKALIGLGQQANKTVILAKPQTFMNDSGFSVASLVRFHKLALERVLVVYDDLDLPLGMLRLREGGGSAGHKGMASIIQQLGSNEFPRLRLGIGRPTGHMDVMDYVLQDFNPQEQEILNLMLNHIEEAAQVFLSEGINAAMTHFNGPVI